jgi:glycosyltransferase involved in cell wall biosynthesis
MRIACIAASRVPSHTANSVQLMKACQALAQLGHEVRLWLPGRPARETWQEIAAQYGLRVQFPVSWLSSVPAFRRYDFCLRAVLAGRGWGADLYYVWPVQAAALASRVGLPTVLEAHDRPQGTLGPWLFGQFLRGPGARRLLHTTEALRRWLADTYRMTLEPPFAVKAPCGVDLERYQGMPGPVEARRMLGLPEGFTAGYTGHTYPGRGIELLFELALRNPGIHFVLAGGEPGAVEHWRRRASEAGAANWGMLGFVPNERLPLAQAASDVLMMPYERRIAISSGVGDSANFASPMKVFEYLAAGRPILSSDLPVLREVLTESNAVLLPPEEVEAWNRALQALAADSSRRAALGAQARRDAERYTTLERARKALEGLEVGRGG